MTGVALAYGAGIALPLAGAPFRPALLLLLLAAGPILLWRRPGPHTRFLLALALLAGLLAGEAAVRERARDCRLHLPRTFTAEVTGRFLGRVEPGRAVPFRVEAGLPGDCRGDVRAVWPRGEAPPPTGARLRGEARWEGRGFPEPGRGEWAGRLRLAADVAPAPGGGATGALLRFRGLVLDRIGTLWGERAAMVEALVLARREHLDPGLREAFGLSGTAHLLAISGFHVGVVAGLLLATLRLAGLRPRPAAAGAAAGAWIYVLGIGAPDAALRAAVLLSLLAATRLRGVPAHPVGTLSTAFVALLLLDPGALASIGFQLSFAGTLGLVTLRRPVERALDRGWRALGREPPRRGPQAGTGERWLRGSSQGVVAGVAATLPTLPLLAWHFDRISLVGIPATLLTAPGVSLAIPGIGASLAVSLASEGAGRFLAGGTGLILALVEEAVRRAAALPGASIWVARGTLVVGAGVAGATALALSGLAHRIRAGVRGAAAAAAAVAGVVVLPLVPLGDALELHMIDVGQGDALALRSPRGHWIVIDAGPRSTGWDAGARRVVPHLRRYGARRIEALVLSHPHLDHIGGAGAVLRELDVRGVLDPAVPARSGPYLEVLEQARDAGVGWWRAETGREASRGGVTLRVLHPPAGPPPDPARMDANDISVVLLVSFGRAHVLLTGDAYADVEEAILDDLPELTVLKAGHHGSRTSTSAALLDRTRPRLVLLPLGDGNTFGHPHAEVLARLDERGIPSVRSDRDGTVRIRIRRDGTMRVRTER